MINDQRVDTYKKLHLGNLFVHLLHELYDEIHQFMLQHLLGMEIRNQKRNIVALHPTHVSLDPSLPSLALLSIPYITVGSGCKTYRHSLPPQYEKPLRPLCQKPRKLMYQDPLDLVRLLDSDADSHAIHAGLDEYAFFGIAADG